MDSEYKTECDLHTEDASILAAGLIGPAKRQQEWLDKNMLIILQSQYFTVYSL